MQCYFTIGQNEHQVEVFVQEVCFFGMELPEIVPDEGKSLGRPQAFATLKKMFHLPVLFQVL